ncbi:MAG: Gfo/Idh/MocA family oxidoreductase [Phycisphaerae bacterium]|nr:Gfo/Idh/MocA family oxidoreductase [Phycisphaerae bacterium]
MSKINVGICGLGRSGLGIHVKAIQEHVSDLYRMVAVADVNREHADAKANEFGCRAWDSPEKLFGDPEVEMVVVATLSNDHARHAIEAMEAGKDVLVEKPMATCYGDARRMIEASKRTGRRLTVFHNRRYDADFEVIRRLRDAGELGEPFSISSFIHNYSFRDDWQLQSRFGGGLLNNWGPHTVDQVLVLAGQRPVSVYANLQQRVNQGDVEDHFKVVITFENGLIGQTEVSAAALAGLPRWQVLADRTAILASDDKKIVLYRYQDGQTVTEEHAPQGGFGEQSGRFYREMHHRAQSGQPTLVDPESAADVVRVIEAAKLSSREKMSINLNDVA